MSWLLYRVINDNNIGTWHSEIKTEMKAGETFCD